MRQHRSIAFKPNWSKHAKAAPFRRNDEMLSVMPAGVIIFPGSGITETFATRPAASASPSGN
jgi:hypothetical protein